MGWAVSESQFSLSASIDADFDDSDPGGSLAACAPSLAASFFGGLAKGILLGAATLAVMAVLPEAVAIGAAIGLAALGVAGAVKLWQNWGQMTPKQKANSAGEILGGLAVGGAAGLARGAVGEEAALVSEVGDSVESPALEAGPPVITGPTLRPGLADKWLTPNGQPLWPPNDGFAEPPVSDTLMPDGPNAIIDRYGGPGGTYFSPVGTPFKNRALPYDPMTIAPIRYQVLKPLPVSRGTAAEWFDQPGGGSQFMTEKSASELVDEEYLKELPPE
jgi:hypothetical protein